VKVNSGDAEGTDRDSSIVDFVISPLVSLMKDQIENIDSYGIECAYIGETQNEGMIGYNIRR